METQVAIQIAAEMLRRGIADALLQTHHLHILCHHVNDEVGGQAVGAVIQPFDPVAVAQGGDPDRTVLVVDLGVVIVHLELGHHIRQLAQLAVAQLGGGVTIQHGDLVEGDLLHLAGKVAGLHRQQIPIIGGPNELPADDAADNGREDHGQSQEERDLALLLHEAKVALGSLSLKAGSKNGHNAVHGAQQDHEDVQRAGVQVQRRQLHIVVYRGHQQRHRQVQQRAAQGSADGLAGFFLLLGLAGKGILAGKALKIGVIPVCIHRVAPLVVLGDVKVL